MDSFTTQYIATALWSSTDDSDKPLDDQYTIDDLHPEALKAMLTDCDLFQQSNANDIDSFPNDSDRETDEQAGHDFWLTRNGHGSGFWDGDWPEPHADRLTKASEAFGVKNLYVGDDGKIHQA